MGDYGRNSRELLTFDNKHHATDASSAKIRYHIMLQTIKDPCLNAQERYAVKLQNRMLDADAGNVHGGLGHKLVAPG